MSIELPPTVKKGNRYTVRVRQITGARVGGGRKVEPGQTIKRDRQGWINMAMQPDGAPPATAVAVARGQGFFYRRTIGAFGLTIPVSTRGALLHDEERTLSILRHIELSIPLESRWWPVFRQLVGLHAGRVAGMGGDPTRIVQTGDGDWRHPIKGDGHRGDHDGDGKHDHRQGDDDHAHGCRDEAIEPRKGESVKGKVASLCFDHFGDFTGFVIETYADEMVTVLSRERRIEALAREAWKKRAIVQVQLLPRHRVGTLELMCQIDSP